MRTKAHILDDRQLSNSCMDDPRVVVGTSRIKITKDPASDSNIACEYIIIDNAREARMLAFLLCEAADKLEAA